MYGASAANIAFGILILLPRRPAWLWSAQIAIVLAYTAITWRLPALSLEPFGPVAKNLPILALLIPLKQLQLSSTVLFGTGPGSAIYIFLASRSGDARSHTMRILRIDCESSLTAID